MVVQRRNGNISQKIVEGPQESGNSIPALSCRGINVCGDGVEQEMAQRLQVGSEIAGAAIGLGVEVDNDLPEIVRAGLDLIPLPGALHVFRIVGIGDT